MGAQALSEMGVSGAHRGRVAVDLPDQNGTDEACAPLRVPSGPMAQPDLGARQGDSVFAAPSLGDRTPSVICSMLPSPRAILMVSPIQPAMSGRHIAAAMRRSRPATIEKWVAKPMLIAPLIHIKAGP